MFFSTLAAATTSSETKFWVLLLSSEVTTSKLHTFFHSFMRQTLLLLGVLSDFEAVKLGFKCY